MKKALPLMLFILLSYTAAADLPLLEESVFISNERKHFLAAGIETLGVNGFFTVLNGYVLNQPWMRPELQTIRDKFSGADPWIWEATDGFKVNNFGHPYQGSLYYNSGRANGFGFYESIFFASLGSFTWEAFCESTPGSFNDMAVTTFGSAPVGEMLHRLYLEACAAGVPWPLALVISPVDGINRFVTKRQPVVSGGNIYGFSLFADTAYSRHESVEKDGNSSLFSFNGSAGGFGFNVIYGNPFEMHSSVPYSHFELKMALDVNFKNYFDMRLVSDGYLFSFSPLDTTDAQLSTGLSLHLDFVSMGHFSVYDSDIDQYSNALDWSAKYRRVLGSNFSMQLKAHGGITFFGVSEYFSPDTEDQSLKNYGTGVNVKLSFDLEHGALGLLSFNIYHYYLHSFPEIVPFSAGDVVWLFADATYSHQIARHLSIGITNSFAMEKGFFSGLPGTDKWANSVKTFVKWSL